MFLTNETYVSGSNTKFKILHELQKCYNLIIKKKHSLRSCKQKNLLKKRA